MISVKLAEARVSFELLLEQGDIERAVMVLERALPAIRTEDEARLALELVERIPEAQRIESIDAACAYAYLLNRNRRFADTLEFAARVLEKHGATQAASVQIESGGVASLDVIGDALYADSLGPPEPTRVRQAIWKLVKKLREALGWEGSVRALRGAYRLDPDATWEYDVAEARSRGRFEGPFLEGVYSGWVLEVARSLEMLSNGAKRPVELN